MVVFSIYISLQPTICSKSGFPKQSRLSPLSLLSNPIQRIEWYFSQSNSKKINVSEFSEDKIKVSWMTRLCLGRVKHTDKQPDGAGTVHTAKRALWGQSGCVCLEFPTSTRKTNAPVYTSVRSRLSLDLGLGLHYRAVLLLLDYFSVSSS